MVGEYSQIERMLVSNSRSIVRQNKSGEIFTAFFLVIGVDLTFDSSIEMTSLDLLFNVLGQEGLCSSSLIIFYVMESFCIAAFTARYATIAV